MDTVRDTSNTTKNMYLNLSDLYASIGDAPIIYRSGPTQDFEQDAVAALKSVNNRLFINAGDLSTIIRADRQYYSDDKIISIIIPGLRGVYTDRRNLTTGEISKSIITYQNMDMPTFVDIYQYPSLTHMRPYVETLDYQLLGEITPADVVTISVKEFIHSKGQDIKIILEDIDAIVHIYQ